MKTREFSNEFSSPDGIQTHDLFFERDEVERSGRPRNSLAILYIASLQRTSEKRPIVLRKSTERGGQQAAPFNSQRRVHVRRLATSRVARSARLSPRAARAASTPPLASY